LCNCSGAVWPGSRWSKVSAPLLTYPITWY
jgi:hypothetical protein